MKRIKQIKPTEIQQRTFEAKLVNPKLSMGQAMIQGGYTEISASHPKQNFVDSRGFDTLREEYKKQLSDLGLGTAKIAAKMAEWLDAEKPFSSHTEPDRLIPDYQTQIKAGEMLREDLGLTQEINVAVQVNNISPEKLKDEELDSIVS